MARQLTLEIAVEKQRAQAELKDLETSLQKVTEEAKKAGVVTDEMSARYDRWGKRVAATKAEIKSYDDQLKKVSGSAESHAKATGLLSTAITRYAGALAIGAAIKGTIAWADKLEDLAQNTGIAASTLAKFDKIARTHGSTIDSLVGGFSVLQDRVGGGDKSAVRAFDKLGISLDAFKTMTPEQQVLRLADAISHITNQNDLATISNDLFGRSGMKNIDVLRGIATEFKNLSGPTDDQIVAMAALADKWESFKGILAQVIMAALSPVAKGINVVTDAVSAMGSVLPGVGRAWEVLTGPLAAATFFLDDFKNKWELMHQAIERDLGITFRTDLGTPKVPGAPDLGTPVGGLPEALGLDEALRLGKEITADVEKQIAARTDNHSKVRETTSALKEQLSVMDMQAQRMSDISEFFGYKPKNFAWEDYNPMPNAPGAPGANGPNNAQNILSPYFGNVSGNNNPNMPSFWRRQGQDLGAAQANWRQQNFGSAEGWMNSAQGWGSELQDISEHGDPLVNATNVRGRGKRAAMGALKGAEIGGKFGGPYGAAGGAVVGLLVGAFRNPAFEDVWNRIAKNFGVEVSDELAKRIADRAKTDYHNNRGAAEVRSLGDILGETGGLNLENIDKMTARLHDAFSLFGTGVFNKKDLQGTLDESFGYFAEYYTKIGGLADKSFTDIVRLARESGVESAEVQKYITAQVETATAGLEMYLENATVKSQSAATGLAESMVLLFDEIRSGPEGLRGAIDAIGPMISALNEQMTAAGFVGDEAFGKILEDVQAFQVEGVAAATTAVDGLTMTLEGLTNSTLLNASAFSGLSRAMTDEIEVARQALIAQGKDGDAALRLNAAGLQTVWELQKQFGWAVDESTQAMLDQAEAQGLIGKEFMDTNLQMLDAMERAADALDRIATGFGFVADAAADAGDVIDEATRPRTVEVGYDFPDEGPRGPNGNPDGYARGGYVRPRYAATGMFVPRGSDTVPAMLTPGEGVLSRRGMRALDRLNEGGAAGGGATFNVTVNANSRDGGRDAAEAFVNELRRRGVKLAGVA